MDVLQAITQEYKKNDIPAFGVGDTVKVHIKIKEGSRERIQIFEGFVLKKQNGGIGEKLMPFYIVFDLACKYVCTDCFDKESAINS